MDFAALMFPKPERWQDAVAAEEFGYTHFWVPDSQMIWGDCYACMALCAEHTKKIKLMSGVSIAGTRIAPVTAHSIATINQLAPGRVILGLGTGHTARRVMGLKPIRLAQFRAYVQMCRDLLDGKEVVYREDGEERTIHFLHLDRAFINIRDRIPIYIAANKPKALALVGELGDGLIVWALNTLELIRTAIAQAQEGAQRAGRQPGADLYVATGLGVCLLRPGEDLSSPRVVWTIGHNVMAVIHFYWEQVRSPDEVPAELRDTFVRYCDFVKQMKSPPHKRYLEIHDGHCTYLRPEEAQFVTPQTIKATAIAGPPEEVIERIRTLEKAGVKQVLLNFPMDNYRELLEEFARRVIEKY